MKSKIFCNRFRIALIILMFFVGLFSCRAPREISVERLRPLSVEKLLEQAEFNAFDYDDLTIRKINVQYSNSESRLNFKATLQAVKDDRILVSISKLNIPVARVLLSRDNITYVNYLERNYFTGGYSFLSDILKFNLSFETIQSIISYKVIPDLKQNRYISHVEGGKYVLQTEGIRTESKSGYIRSLFAGRKVSASKSVNTDSDGLIKTMYFNSRSLLLDRLIYDDPGNDWKLDINFSDFEKVSKKDYPSTIALKFLSSDETIDMKIKMNGFSVEGINSFELPIPGNYQKIRPR